MQAETDKAEAEFSFLKAQINPHFLFNTLNNIYVLTLSAHPNTVASIMKLSNIMRRSDRALLQEELDCIENLISLQKLKLGEKTPVHFAVTGIIADKKIAPLILMTFVENAFKYRVSKQKPSAINIAVIADEKSIHFHSDNTIFAGDSTINSTKIGIENTRKRLQRVYPQTHELKINRQDGRFIVDLVTFT